MIRTTKIFRILLLTLLAGTLFGEDNESSVLSDEELRSMLFGDVYSDDPEVIEKPSLTWIPSYSGEFGAGYSDNPLYGPYLREEASFLESSVEAFYLAQSKPENFTYFYFFGEGKVFEDLSENKTSGILLGQFDHAHSPSDSSRTLGLRIRHTYYNQGFDFSELGLPYSMEVKSNKSEVIPYLSHQWSDSAKGTAEFSLGKEDFASIRDDNRDWKVSLTYDGDFRSLELKFNAFLEKKNYKYRLKRKWDGEVLSNETMGTTKRGLSLQLKKFGFESILTSSTIKMAWTSLRDDGGGYYDYERLSLVLKQDWTLDPWLVEFETSGSTTTYKSREAPNGAKFDRSGLRLGASLSRPINERIDYYLKWSREEDFSNSRDYEYYTNYWSTGIQWEI